MALARQAAPGRVSRLLSRRSMFEVLLHKGPISRADLAKVTGLSKQTTSEVIESFEQQGIVRPVGRTSGNIGRTAVLYELSPEAGHALGVDVGATNLRVAIADISSKVRCEAVEPTHAQGGLRVLDQIERLASRLARDMGTHLRRVRSITIATPGVVNPKTGAIELAPNISGLNQIDVIGLLSDRLGSPVRIENDVNLALLGEIWHGCAQGFANVALISLGTGIGLGLYVNGSLVRGAHGAAGEIGYLPFPGNSNMPEASSQGCLEYEVAAGGILRRYKAAGGSPDADVPSLFELMERGNELATAAITETARLAALTAAMVIATIDPKLLILGGSIGGRPEFAGRVAQQLSLVCSRSIEIRPSALSNRATITGALAIALSRLHEDLFGITDLPGAMALPAPATAAGARTHPGPAG